MNQGRLKKKKISIKSITNKQNINSAKQIIFRKQSRTIIFGDCNC